MVVIMNNTDLRNGLEKGWVETDFVKNLGLRDVADFNRQFNDLYKCNPKEKEKKIRMLNSNKKEKKRKESREKKESRKKQHSDITEVPESFEVSEVFETRETPGITEIPEVTEFHAESEEDLQKELKNCENRIVQLEIDQADLAKENRADEKTLSEIQLELKVVRQHVLEMQERAKTILEKVAGREETMKKLEFDLSFERECKVELEEKVEAARFTVVYCGSKSDIKADFCLSDFGLSEAEINRKVIEILTIPAIMDLKVHEVKKISILLLVAEGGKINFLVDTDGEYDKKIEKIVKEVNKDVKFTYLK